MTTLRTVADPGLKAVIPGEEIRRQDIMDAFPLIAHTLTETQGV